MNVLFDLPDGFYAVYKKELYSVSLPMAKFKNAKSIKIAKLELKCDKTNRPISEDIQHVGYDDSQLGRDK